LLTDSAKANPQTTLTVERPFAIDNQPPSEVSLIREVEQALTTIKPDIPRPELDKNFAELLSRINDLKDAVYTRPAKVTNPTISNPSIALICCWESKAASSLSLGEACALLDIDYQAGVEKYIFEMPSVNGKGKAPRGTPFLGSIYALPYLGSLD
jgi:hypothetical protein